MSLFKKLVSKILNQPEEEDTKPNVTKLADQLRDADLDYKFAQLFTHSGGYFNYCADEAEALHTLNQIIKIEQIDNVFCWDKELQSFLDVINSDYVETLNSREKPIDAAFITCDYLISFDGRIMLSYNNILNYRTSDLPATVIIMANVSQIVSNLNEAMMKVKRLGNQKNLTSISGGQSNLDTPEKANTKLFLLLLED